MRCQRNQPRRRGDRTMLRLYWVFTHHPQLLHAYKGLPLLIRESLQRLNGRSRAVLAELARDMDYTRVAGITLHHGTGKVGVSTETVRLLHVQALRHLLYDVRRHLGQRLFYEVEDHLSRCTRRSGDSYCLVPTGLPEEEDTLFAEDMADYAAEVLTKVRELASQDTPAVREDRELYCRLFDELEWTDLVRKATSQGPEHAEWWYAGVLAHRAHFEEEVFHELRSTAAANIFV